MPPLADRPLFFLDYDGTLAPIVDNPEEAFPHADVPALLAELERRHPLWIITGRHLDHVAALMPDVRPRGIGLHGTQEGRLGGDVRSLMSSEAQDGIARLRQSVPQRADVRVEEKGATFAVHYRHAADKAAAKEAIRDWLGDMPTASPRSGARTSSSSGPRGSARASPSAASPRTSPTARPSTSATTSPTRTPSRRSARRPSPSRSARGRRRPATASRTSRPWSRTSSGTWPRARDDFRLGWLGSNESRRGALPVALLAGFRPLLAVLPRRRRQEVSRPPLRPTRPPPRTHPKALREGAPGQTRPRPLGRREEAITASRSAPPSASLRRGGPRDGKKRGRSGRRLWRGRGLALRWIRPRGARWSLACSPTRWPSSYVEAISHESVRQVSKKREAVARPHVIPASAAFVFGWRPCSTPTPAPTTRSGPWWPRRGPQAAMSETRRPFTGSGHAPRRPSTSARGCGRSLAEPLGGFARCSSKG